MEGLFARLDPGRVAFLPGGHQRHGGTGHQASGLPLLAEGLPVRQRLRAQQLARLVGQ